MSLESALKKEKTQLNYLTTEVERLRSLRKKKQINSLKEKLSAVCDLHRLVLERVEEQTYEIDFERKRRRQLAKDAVSIQELLFSCCLCMNSVSLSSPKWLEL